MTWPARVAVTGPSGRLGRALVTELQRAGWEIVPWARPDYDLDDPGAAERLVGRDAPGLVIHAAAWTDVEGCAREPDLARRRNALAVGELAAACARAGVNLVHVSTNEVFDGERSDGRGYREDDTPRPINPYGASKLDGERAAEEAFGATPGSGGRRAVGLWIVRTAWLFGPPGNDFPAKILRAAQRLPPGEPLRVVRDESGSPTFAPDLARAMVRLVATAAPGLYHLASPAPVSRLAWAERVVAACGISVRLEPIERSAYVRASTPPGWAVLDSAKATAGGVTLRPWQEALEDYLDALCPAR